MSIRPNQWAVVGNTRRTLNLGEVRNATENGWWVYWHTDCRAEVVPHLHEHEVYDTHEQASAEFERRAALLWGGV